MASALTVLTKRLPLSSFAYYAQIPRRFAHATAHVDLAFEEVKPTSKEAPSKASNAPGPLVICHGLFGSKQNWRGIAKAFGKNMDIPVYSLDLRNHGASPHSEQMDYATMANDILEFCDKHSLSNISLLGHSMGGKVVMAVALSPDLPSNLLHRLIVADVSPAKGPISEEFRQYVKGMKEIEATGAKTRKDADAVLQKYEDSVMVRQFLLTNLESATATKPQRFRIPLDTLDRAIEGIGDFPYEPQHRKWEGKTLFIKGSKSKYLNKKNIPIAQEYFPNMKLVTLEGGHWIHVEQPAGFMKTVTEFILEP